MYEDGAKEEKKQPTAESDVEDVEHDTQPQKAENGVKPEPTDDAIPARKEREGTPPHELHIYSIEELSKFKKRELLADVTLLDGLWSLTIGSQCCTNLRIQNKLRTRARISRFSRNTESENKSSSIALKTSKR